jgi:hypothetical protein
MSVNVTLWSYGLQHRVQWSVGTQVSKKHAACIFRVQTETHGLLERWYMPTRLHSAVAHSFRFCVSPLLQVCKIVISAFSRVNVLSM